MRRGLMYKEGAKLFEKRLMLNATAYNFIWCEGAVRTNVQGVRPRKGRDHRAQRVRRAGRRGRARAADRAGVAARGERGLPRAFRLDAAGLPGRLLPVAHPRRGRPSAGRCILDAEGERLALGVEAKPYLIKPNRFELETMVGRELRSLADVRDAALKYIDRGVSVAAVSLGADGALITDGAETLFAPRLAVEVKSTVGAGDAMVAGLACGVIGDCGLEEMFRMGVAGRHGALRYGQLPRGRPRAVPVAARPGGDRARLTGARRAGFLKNFVPARRRSRARARIRCIERPALPANREARGMAMRSERMGCLLIGEAAEEGSARCASACARRAWRRSGSRRAARTFWKRRRRHCTRRGERAGRASPRRARAGPWRWRWPRRLSVDRVALFEPEAEGAPESRGALGRIEAYARAQPVFLRGRRARARGRGRRPLAGARMARPVQRARGARVAARSKMDETVNNRPLRPPRGFLEAGVSPFALAKSRKTCIIEA